MKRRTRFVAAVVALSAIVTIPLAYAGGLWFGLPVVGGGTYCSGATGTGTAPTTGIGTGGATTVCNVTVPAGPTSMTGQELLPADLNPSGTQVLYPGPGIAQSGAPQTGYMPLANAASGAYQLLAVLTPTTTFTASINNGVNTVYVAATGTQTAVTFIFPVTPTDGQIIRFASAATITTASWVTPTGSAVSQGIFAPTATRAFSLYPSGYGGGASTNATGPFGVTYLWSSSLAAWARIQ